MPAVSLKSPSGRPEPSSGRLKATTICSAPFFALTKPALFGTAGVGEGVGEGVGVGVEPEPEPESVTDAAFGVTKSPLPMLTFATIEFVRHEPVMVMKFCGAS